MLFCLFCGAKFWKKRNCDREGEQAWSTMKEKWPDIAQRFSDCVYELLERQKDAAQDEELMKVKDCPWEQAFVDKVNNILREQIESVTSNAHTDEEFSYAFADALNAWFDAKRAEQDSEAVSAALANMQCS